jgi:rSAM/selenodomain-associated transferase 1
MRKILVIAKAPDAGRVKTRLCPPCTYEDAARIAEAALEDTVDAARSVANAKTVLVLDGAPGPWVPRGVEVIAQHGNGLAQRIANAFADAGAPALLIGMDTPQVTPRMLSDALRTLDMPDVDAVLGRAVDGGWWTIGFNDVVAGAFDGVPMSTSYTSLAQRRRLKALGLRVARLPTLRDVDTFSDAIAVAGDIPRTRFGRAVRAVQRAAVAQWEYAWRSGT